MADMESPYRGFVIAWQEPPAAPTKWVLTVAADNPKLREMIVDEPYVIEAPTRSAGFGSACAYIDELLSR